VKREGVHIYSQRDANADSLLASETHSPMWTPAIAGGGKPEDAAIQSHFFWQSEIGLQSDVAQTSAAGLKYQMKKSATLQH